ncbi:hypothetical protein C1645_731695 [Glomus cerebriforme]|uniref:Galactose oxidase n=1 Tax=Glomus cerebriforme TaxID=658196 RepID=A0A397TJT4_9GLOM|nr:hypothetical protein C1645_731695 [Glomus cerebriforme]
MIVIIIIFLILNFINLILGLPIITSNIQPRWGHSATLVNSKIYFIGGRTVGNVLATEFLSLDVSTTFTTLQPVWDLLDTIGIPKTVGHSAVRGGLNNDQIIIFGGGVDDVATALTNSLYVYDTTSNLLSNPKIPNGPNRRYEHSAISNPLGEMLIYGGLIDPSTGNQKTITTSELWELNTSNLISLNSWNGYELIDNSPGIRRSHTASLIDNKMYILGGLAGDTLLGMNVIYVFDLNENSWDVKTSTGEIPTSRSEHSAVVANKKIIIYGGTDSTRNILYGDVAILDTNTWIWSSQDTTNPPSNRRGHTATLVGANMIVAFGTTDISIESNIYILNILNWSWITQYIPMELPIDDGTYTTMSNITNPNINHNQQNDLNNKDETNRIYLIVIIVLAVICGILFIIIISYVIYKIIDKRKIESGEILVGYPYNSNPPPTTQPPSNNKHRPTFLCLNRSNKKLKHESTEVLFGNTSVPTSPSTGPSTPHTSNRFSNSSGVGRVTFSNIIEQYSPESEGSDQSPLDIEREAENIREKLGANNDTISQRPSVDDLRYRNFK